MLNSDGHQSFISDTSFVADTYPDKYRMAKIYKADINTQSADLLLSIYSPKEFQTKDFKCHISLRFTSQSIPFWKVPML